ncbi:MAG TPA: RNA polymerase-binding protein DksA [Albitalea sp.]|uniref:RNA polymerase-binding protein DksA n=1 Tax=Piscinibacter sp. TaxID=1903157 RepID=UPI002ED64CAD
MSTTPAKKATTKKPAAKTPAAKAPAKPASKAAAKPAPKPPAKPAPKAAPKPAAKAAPKPAPKPAPKAPAHHAKPAAAPHHPPAAAHRAPAPAKPAPAPSPKSSSRAHAAAPVAVALPPPTSRFADRFAPPRPPTRQMNNLAVDTPKQPHKADPKLANAWKTKSGKDLTEAEVLAMPDSEYMNDKQLEFFRARLQMLKDDLLSNAGETTEHLREDTSIVPDPADRATIEEEHALELRTRDRERKLLKKISQSLGRIDAGDYGFCDETGEPIGLGRLIARPTATLSLEAQQRRELKQKMFGD